MPMAGIGTFMLSPDEAENSVINALQDGYYLIDTANAYVNEKAVGRAMKKSGIARENTSFYEQEDGKNTGNIVIPGSKNPDHIRANFELFDFALSDEEMAEIGALNKNKRYYTSTPEMLKAYAEMVPPVDEQK